MKTQTHTLALLALAISLCLSATNSWAQTRSEQPKVLLEKDGTVSINGEAVALAELGTALKKNGAKKILIRQKPGFRELEQVNEALRISGVELATYIDEKGDTLFRIRFGKDKPAAEVVAQPVKIYRVKEKVEIDGKLYTNAELAAELKRRKAVSVLIYLKEPGCVGEDAIAFRRALRDSGIGVAEYRDAQDRPQARSVFKDEFLIPRGGGGGAAAPAKPNKPAADAPPAAAPPSN